MGKREEDLRRLPVPVRIPRPGEGRIPLVPPLGRRRNRVTVSRRV